MRSPVAGTAAAARGRFRTAALVVALSGAVAPGASAQVDPSREYQIKAAFLFNFGQFVDWRPEALPAEGSPFVIGVLGDDPFGPILDAIVAGQRIHGREVEVVRFDRVEDVGSCHILFVSDSEGPRLAHVFGALAGRSILTVGESPGFADRNGVIRFVVVDNRLRLEINMMAASDADLTISSKLLRLADVVHAGER